MTTVDLDGPFTGLFRLVAADTVARFRNTAQMLPGVAPGPTIVAGASTPPPPPPAWWVGDAQALMSVELWERLVADLVAEPLTQAVTVAARGAAAKAGVAFDVVSPLVGDAALAHVNAIRSWAPDLRIRVGGIVEAGMRGGLSVDDVAGRLVDVVFSPNRARLIARTELIAAGNAGTYLTWAATSGAAGTKRWLSRPDPRTRHSHRDANGQTVPVAEMFLIGGFEARYPGDPLLPVAERANCRCVMVRGDLDGAPTAIRTLAIYPVRTAIPDGDHAS